MILEYPQHVNFLMDSDNLMESGVPHLQTNPDGCRKSDDNIISLINGRVETSIFGYTCNYGLAVPTVKGWRLVGHVPFGELLIAGLGN